jgi:hypothetical protein
MSGIIGSKIRGIDRRQRHCAFGLKSLAKSFGLLHQRHRFIDVAFFSKSLGLLLQLLDLCADLLCILQVEVDKAHEFGIAGRGWDETSCWMSK